MRTYIADISVLAKDGSGESILDNRATIRAENLDAMRRQVIKDYSKYRTTVIAWCYYANAKARSARVIINRNGTVEFHTYGPHHFEMWNVDPRTGRLTTKIPKPKVEW